MFFSGIAAPSSEKSAHQPPHAVRGVPRCSRRPESLASGINRCEPIAFFFQGQGLHRVNGLSLGVDLCIDHRDTGPSCCESVLDSVVEALVFPGLVGSILSSEALIAAVP